MALSGCLLVLFFANVEEAFLLSTAVNHVSLRIFEHTLNSLDSITSHSVEFCGKFSLGLNKLELFIKSHFSQLNAELELATLLDLVLVLHIWVHVTKEELLVSLVRKADTHSLVSGVALETQLVVCFNDIV